MYQRSLTLRTALFRLPARRFTLRLFPAAKGIPVLRRFSSTPTQTVCPDSLSLKPTSGPSVAAASPVSGCSIGGSTSRLYSALAQSYQNAAVLTEPEPGEVEQLLKECEEMLRRRPARLHRHFIPTGTPSGEEDWPFRVMQWNVLAQALGEGKDGFVRCPPAALGWAERKYLILEEILSCLPDVLCLQEVDHYFDTFKPVLSRLGYHCSFCPKPWSPCLDVPDNNGPDGCALFFRHARFELLDSVSLTLSAALRRTNQVAVVQTLGCRASGRRLCVAVTHLKARSGWERLRGAQGAHLLRRLEQITHGARIPLLVCGDFNAEPGEEVYQRFATSSLGLGSAYTLLSADSQSEPPYTSWTIRPGGESCHTLDYIWYSRRALRVHRLLHLPSAEQIGPDRLPSYRYPSDHLSLVCDVSFHRQSLHCA